MNDEQNRPLGVAHLIFGLVFTGIAAIWLIGKANDTDLPDLAAAFPAVLIVAGVIGLGASIVNQRRARARELAQHRAALAAYEAQFPAEQSAVAEEQVDPTTDDTDVLDTPADTDTPKDPS